MPAGNQPNMDTVNNTLTSLAVQLRDVMEKVRSQMVPIGNMNVAGLVKLGFSDVSNPDNPDGKSDAQYVLDEFSYMNTVAGVYFGLVQQGGTDGTGATKFDFNSALSAAWGGQ